MFWQLVSVALMFLLCVSVCVSAWWSCDHILHCSWWSCNSSFTLPPSGHTEQTYIWWKLHNIVAGMSAYIMSHYFIVRSSKARVLTMRNMIIHKVLIINVTSTVKHNNDYNLLNIYPGIANDKYWLYFTNINKWQITRFNSCKKGFLLWNGCICSSWIVQIAFATTLKQGLDWWLRYSQYGTKAAVTNNEQNKTASIKLLISSKQLGCETAS